MKRTGDLKKRAEQSASREAKKTLSSGLTWTWSTTSWIRLPEAQNRTR